jgi:hypothetical protein
MSTVLTSYSKTRSQPLAAPTIGVGKPFSIPLRPAGRPFRKICLVVGENTRTRVSVLYFGLPRHGGPAFVYCDRHVEGRRRCRWALWTAWSNLQFAATNHLSFIPLSHGARSPDRSHERLAKRARRQRSLQSCDSSDIGETPTAQTSARSSSL